MKHVRILIAVLTALLMVAPAALAQVKPQQPVPVPNVTGYKIGDAQQTLHKQGFKTALKLKPVEDSRQAALVFEQNPHPGTTALPAQTTVTLTVGDYQVQPRVPGVTGMPLDKAQQAMASAGFNAVVTMENVTDKSKDNVVLRQQVPGGAMLAKGSKVPVVVGRYTAPAQAKVPYVTGKPLAEAQKILADNKLNAQVSMQPVAQPQQDGMVLSQKFPVGTPLAPGSMVPVIVGRYTPPAMAAVPNVTGKPLAEAQKILADNKLNAQVTMKPVAQPQQNGVVLSQTLSVGTPLAPGSMVPVIVGRYTPPAMAAVPNVTGKPLAEAQKILADNKLNAVVSMEAVTDPAKNNVVLKQQAAPGTQLAPGSQVSLVAGKYTPPAPMPVPSVKGMTIDQARQQLEKQGWKVETLRLAQKDRAKNNVVLEQMPAAGVKVVPQQTPVRLTYGFYMPPATGGQVDNRQQPLNPPIEPDEVMMPDTVGKSLADARNAVGSRGLSPNRIVVHERVVSDPKLAGGVVRSQKPGAGASVPYKSSSPIELWVDIYKKQS